MAPVCSIRPTVSNAMQPDRSRVKAAKTAAVMGLDVTECMSRETLN